MGFFDTILHSVPNILDWTLKIAGHIPSVVEAITKILPHSTVFDPEDEDTDPNMLVKLNNNFEAATRHLQKTVEGDASFKPPKGDTTTKVDGPYDLLALWPSPATQDGKLPPAVSADINKFLTLHKLPTSLGSAGDLGAEIAKGMFDRTGTSFATETGLRKKTFQVLNSDPKYEIHGGHMFYKIPLGNPGSDEAWHSMLRVYTTEPENTEAQYATAKKLPKIKQRPFELAAGETAYCLTKISAKFTGANDSVHKLMRDAIQEVVKGSANKITFKNWAHDGTNFTIEFQCPTTVGPGEIACSLSSAIGKHLPKSNNNLPQMPQVEVVSTTTYV